MSQASNWSQHVGMPLECSTGSLLVCTEILDGTLQSLGQTLTLPGLGLPGLAFQPQPLSLIFVMSLASESVPAGTAGAHAHCLLRQPS